MIASFLLLAMIVSPADVTGRIATDVTFPEKAGQQVAEAAVKLLSTCIYEARANEEQFVQAQRGSHLRVSFRRPSSVEVNGEKTFEVKELIVTLPLASGSVLIRTDAGYRYFAKFTESGRELQLLLREAAPRE